MIIRLSVAILLIILSICILAFTPIIFGAPFDPTRNRELKKMLSLKISKDKKIVDLGSGNGKIIIAFAEKGYEAHGYEINPLLVLWTKLKIYKKGLRKKAFVHWKNFWRVNLSKYDVVIIFQIFYIMSHLEKKLKKELKKDSIIISNRWKFPNLKPEKINGYVRVYKV